MEDAHGQRQPHGYEFDPASESHSQLFYPLSLTRRVPQVRSIADVTRAVAEGDLSRKIMVEVKGEMLDLKVSRVLSLLWNATDRSTHSAYGQ